MPVLTTKGFWSDESEPLISMSFYTIVPAQTDCQKKHGWRYQKRLASKKSKSLDKV